ncbi:MAG: hypothetical protein OEU91_02975 [Gammaproteobacteria bacterium]|nr:hypothetical protein [Gammaproteobacteria bacterium]
MSNRDRHHQPSIAALVIFLSALVFCWLPDTLWAETPAPDLHLEPTEPTGVDLAQEAMSRSVNDAARWFDAFFGDERYVAEEARSRIRLTPSIFIEEGEPAETRLRINARLWLPRLSKKLRLVIADTSEDEESILDQETFSDAGTARNDTTAVGLQYFLRARDKLNLSLTAGLKSGDDHAIDFFIGPRYRRTWAFDTWQMRFTEQVRWYADLGWESRTRFDFERLLREDLFVRATTDLRWNEQDFDEEGFQLAVTPTLTQRLKSRAGIDYQWFNVFNSRPDFHLESTTLRVRYRQRIWRKWLFYEVNPQLAFRDEDDFDATPGIEIRLEASLGGTY